ncbi:single-stranded DNA-binding protein [Crassaminicella thermophila]|uniref:Single-stranded DNA-binding protein n=1 Tax=Crassaminicella thermophila TaxID=2599308 RepID=A0A5C0SIH7_CRATE|nr:single-stranded DNA-binding protein [Crassaminicella thermophila]QEK13506.1 single-stranded DNA-binding protein [Crassaminicella thermophila]
MNHVVLIGRLTRDPELRFTAGSGRAVATFTIAVDRPFAKEKTADFFRVVVWGKSGENCANYLSKGRLVAVQGRLQNNTYETQNGEKRYTTEVVADRVEFLEWGNRNEQSGFNPSQIDPDGFQAIDDDDDIPF